MRGVFDTRNPMQFHMDWPTGTQQANNTIRYVGWVERACIFDSLRVLATTANSNGTYTLKVTNLSASAECVTGTTFNMNSLSANAVTNVTLNATNNSLIFNKKDKFQIEMVSNNASFNGLGTHLSLLFGEL